MSNDLQRIPGSRIRGRYIALLIACDIAAFAAAPLLALMLRFQAAIPIEHALPQIWFMPVLILIRLFAAVCCDLYDLRRRLTLTDFAFNAAGATVLSIFCGYFFLSTVQLYYWPEIRLSRITAAIDLIGLFLWFVASRAITLTALRLSGYRVRLAVIGIRDTLDSLAAEIRAHAPSMLTVVVPEPSETNALHQLEDALRQGPVDQVVLSESNLAQNDLHALLARVVSIGAEIYLLPGIDMFTVASTRVSSIAGLPLVPLQPSYLASVYRPLKRACDIVVAFTVLALTLPICVLVAIAIKAGSKGPLLFSQPRVGLHGSVIRVLKFRTMIVDAEAGTGPVLSTSGDPRITGIGRFLRKYRIDEWPQLWNVLAGQMTLVGPRPERPEFVAKFIEENPLYERRFLVKPGLTGLAQIHGRYDSNYAHKLRYDLIYINSVSPITDAQILLATIKTILTAHGAQ